MNSNELQLELIGGNCIDKASMLKKENYFRVVKKENLQGMNPVRQ